MYSIWWYSPNWSRNDYLIKMKETSRVQDKELVDKH